MWNQQAALLLSGINTNELRLTKLALKTRNVVHLLALILISLAFIKKSCSHYSFHKHRARTMKIPSSILLQFLCHNLFMKTFQTIVWKCLLPNTFKQLVRDFYVTNCFKMTLCQSSQKRGLLSFTLSTWAGKWTNSMTLKGYSSTFLRVAESASKDDWYRSPYRVARFRNSSIECFIYRDNITSEKIKAKQTKPHTFRKPLHYNILQWRNKKTYPGKIYKVLASSYRLKKKKNHQIYRLLSRLLSTC